MVSSTRLLIELSIIVRVFLKSDAKLLPIFGHMKSEGAKKFQKNAFFMGICQKLPKIKENYKDYS